MHSALAAAAPLESSGWAEASCWPASHFNAPLEKSLSASVKASSAALGSALCKRCRAPRHLLPFSKYSEDMSSVTEWCEGCALNAHRRFEGLCCAGVWPTDLTLTPRSLMLYFSPLFFHCQNDYMPELNGCHVIGWRGIYIIKQLQLKVFQKKTNISSSINSSQWKNVLMTISLNWSFVSSISPPLDIGSAVMFQQTRIVTHMTLK